MRKYAALIPALLVSLAGCSGSQGNTVVGDGAPEDVVAAARGIPVPSANSVLDRVRRACGKVMQAVSGTG